jgi:hypothetical protein
MRVLKGLIQRIKRLISGYRMKDLVWYACYGSNIYKKRFLFYIKGGQPEGSTKCYKGCSDKNAPTYDKQIRIPYELYFSKESSSWENRGVAFIKSERNESVETLGRMYLIKKDQFIEVVRQESGKEPDDESINIDTETAISKGSSLATGIKWYARILYLGSEGNYPIFTCTAKRADEEIELNPPGEEYLKFIVKGLKETYKYPDERIIEYLKKLSGIEGRIDDQDISRLVTSIKLR